ncbi:362_t:CDS:2, partial [Racocetra persica]
KQINAVNLRVDYKYRGEQLKNICLYDYIATIHKIKINSNELDKLNRQKNREGHTTRVDRFLFLGGKKKCDETCDHSMIHPQHATHIQVHWTQILDKQDNFGTDNLVLLNPYEIMHSGLHNTKFVDDAMFHLYLKDKFNDKKEGQLNFQRKFDTMNYDEEHIRPSCENDSNLIKTWQKTIASRKKMEQIDTNISSEENHYSKP